MHVLLGDQYYTELLVCHATCTARFKVNVHSALANLSSLISAKLHVSVVAALLLMSWRGSHTPWHSCRAAQRDRTDIHMSYCTRFKRTYAVTFRHELLDHILLAASVCTVYPSLSSLPAQTTDPRPVIEGTKPRQLCCESLLE